MKSIYLPRSGKLENTTFAILSPDGKQRLSAAGRGPQHAFRGASGMASGLDSISAEFEGRTEPLRSDTQLPLMKSLELALNVAAADGLPLVVTFAESDERLEALNRRLVPSAWKESLAGQFVYVAVGDSKTLRPLTDDVSGEGILLVEPDQFGLSGKVLKHLSLDADRQTIESSMSDVVTTFPRKYKDHNSHVRLGIQLGIDWQSQIPESDPMSVRARQRVRGTN